MHFFFNFGPQLLFLIYVANQQEVSPAISHIFDEHEDFTYQHYGVRH